MNSPSDPPAYPKATADTAPVAADAGEIERLFREHNEALMHFVAARLGSEHEAREVAQEAYVRLLSLDHTGAISYLRAFLYKTAGNLALDRLRQRRRRGYVRAMRDAELAMFELSPEHFTESEQVMDVLHTALEELPDKCRRAFLMHRLHDLSSKEIAAQLGIRERMARMYVARAVEYLRTRLDEIEHEGSAKHGS